MDSSRSSTPQWSKAQAQPVRSSSTRIRIQLAQPNVVYYYQIEDVSLDGNRQTLTNGIRLKGHIGAAGKLTTLWGDLKTSQ